MAMRVTSNGQAQAAQSAMARALGRMNEAQTAVTTGKRILRASDDPVGAAQVQKLNSTLGDLGQYRRNGEHATSVLNLADGALGNLGDMVRQAKDLVLQANNATATPQARAAAAEQIARIKEQVVSIAGTTHNGRYLFSGQKTDTPPFDAADPTNTYRGDAGALRVETDRGEYSVINISGDAVFSQLLDDLDSVRTELAAGKPSANGIAALSGGLDRVLTARGTLGAVGNQITQTRDRLDAAEQEFRVLLSNTEDMDMAQAIVEMQAAQNAYEASLAGTARLFEQSLMDYLR